MILTKKLKYLMLISIIFTDCGVPKEIMNRINSVPKKMMDFPIDYCIALPTPTFEKWDSVYDSFNKFLNAQIMRTQLGISSIDNGVETWWCYPAVRTHTQIDTTTMIKVQKEVIGDWRIICNRKISFTDSASFLDRKIYRNNEVIYNEKDADIFLTMTDSKLKIYGTEKSESKYKLIAKNYSILNGRFLMVYGVSKLSGAMSQIGIDKDGHLIINTYWVEERKIKKQYITYQSIVTQNIFKRQ